MTEPVRKQASLTPKLGAYAARWTTQASPSARAGTTEITRQGSLKCTSHKRRHRWLLTRQCTRPWCEKPSKRATFETPNASADAPNPTRERVHYGDALSTRRVRHETEDLSHRGVLPTGGPHPPQGDFLCMQTIDVYGDHATCCSKAGDLIVRHNAMRNLVNEIAKDSLLSPVLEKKGILGNAPWTPPWRCDHGSSNLESKSPCEAYAQYRKHAKYDKDFKDSETHIFRHPRVGDVRSDQQRR